jgi:hypothetical protein
MTGAIENPLTRVWLGRSLATLAPALRELATILGTPPAFGSPPTPDELTSAADVIERAAACLVHPVGDMAP